VSFVLDSRQVAYLDDLQFLTNKNFDLFQCVSHRSFDILSRVFGVEFDRNSSVLEILKQLPSSIFAEFQRSFDYERNLTELVVSNNWRILQFLEEFGIVPTQKIPLFRPEHSEVTTEGLGYMYKHFPYIFERTSNIIYSTNPEDNIRALLMKDYYCVKERLTRNDISMPRAMSIEIKFGLIKEIEKYDTFSEENIINSLQCGRLEICDYIFHLSSILAFYVKEQNNSFLYFRILINLCVGYG
jgi:hypothetical protein